MRRHGLVLLVLLAWSLPVLFAVPCRMIPAHAPSEAESAFLHGEYDKAVSLYQAQLQQQPGDPETVAGLVRVLLRQQKVPEAESAVRKPLAAAPTSAVLMTALGEVEYRQGAPWLAAQTATGAAKSDPCLPRLHLLFARLFRLNSMYASEDKELHTAHLLDPNDPDIRSAWIGTLTLAQRITELEAYLASPTGDDAEDIHLMKMYLEALKKRADEPHKSCRLVSSSVSTELPFAQIMRDASHIRAFGLDVKLNGHESRLQIDTGASGLLISRSVAQRAGLKPFSATEMWGIGSAGSKNGYTAYADRIQIGSLEFHDCVVRVLDARNVVDSDGLIGMDVFARFLVTLDYPMRKLTLGPLPPRPDDTTSQAPSLATDASDDEEASEKAPASGSPPSGSKAGSSAVSSAHSVALHDRYVAPEMKSYTPVYRVGHNLLITTAVNESRWKLFILGTGSWTSTISPDAAREVTKVHGDNQLQIHGISGKVGQAYTADNITLDFANLRQPAREIVSFDTSMISKRSGLEISGLIGTTTLGQLTTHIDYRDGLVKFDYDPNRGYRMNSR